MKKINEGDRVTIRRALSKKDKQIKKQIEKTRELILCVYRFSYNVGLMDIFQVVYPNDLWNSGCIRSKQEQVEKRGFGSWFCNLDLENQEVVAKMVYDRYPEFAKLLK